MLSLSQGDWVQMWVKFVIPSGSGARRAEGPDCARRCTAFTNAPGALLPSQRGQPGWLSVPMHLFYELQA